MPEKLKRDIFIDNSIAANFPRPADPEYKKLIQWLMKNDLPRKADNAHLVVSNKLLHEYNRTAGNAKPNTTAITLIVFKLTKEGRLVKFENDEIKEFQRNHFKPKTIKKLRCNSEDRDLIPVVLLSDRKYALCRDKEFKRDLEKFPGFKARVGHRPRDLPYAR